MYSDSHDGHISDIRLYALSEASRFTYLYSLKPQHSILVKKSTWSRTGAFPAQVISAPTNDLSRFLIRCSHAHTARARRQRGIDSCEMMRASGVNCSG